MYNTELEQTLVLIKPDAMKNSLAGYILSQLSEFHTGLIFAATKVVHVTRMLAEEHYAEHRGKVFYPSLILMSRTNAELRQLCIKVPAPLKRSATWQALPILIAPERRSRDVSVLWGRSCP